MATYPPPSFFFFFSIVKAKKPDVLTILCRVRARLDVMASMWKSEANCLASVLSSPLVEGVCLVFTTVLCPRDPVSLLRSAGVTRVPWCPAFGFLHILRTKLGG